MSYGSTQYDRSAGKALAPRDLEATAFAFINKLLEEAKEDRERITALGRNHRLWALLLTDIGMSNNALPPILKKDLVSVGTWSMSYSIAAMGRDLPVKPLIDINRDMIEALRSSASTQKAAISSTPTPAGSRISVAVAI
jgi:flagellar biosynthesis activator protein FlaF